MSSLLSIVIPVFQSETALAQTLASIRAADPKGDWIEVVIQDGTPGAQCDEPEGNLAIRRIAELDEGIYDAMNRGMKHASGKWVLFAGAGDLLMDGPRLRQALEQGNFPLQVFQTELLPPLEPGVPSFYPAQWNRRLRWKHIVHHQGICYLRTALPESPFDEAWIVLADYALHLRLWEEHWQADLHDFTAMQVAPGGVSRSFQRTLYWEEARMKRSILGTWRAASQWPWIASKWLFKKWKAL